MFPALALLVAPYALVAAWLWCRRPEPPRAPHALPCVRIATYLATPPAPPPPPVLWRPRAIPDVPAAAATAAAPRRRLAVIIPGDQSWLAWATAT